MERAEIVEKTQEIFRKIFKNNSLILTDEMTATDVDGWDSLTHMVLIAEIEKAFSIKFKLKDLNKMKNVGICIDIVKAKLEE
jgi:acyl carrier protein